jgi:hypothetical protein
MEFLKKDELYLGLILGAIGPLLGFVGFYFWKFNQFTFADFIHALQQNKQLVTSLTIPCLLVNIILFTIYTNVQKDKTAKGIFIVTIIYAVISLLFKIWS